MIRVDPAQVGYDEGPEVAALGAVPLVSQSGHQTARAAAILRLFAGQRRREAEPGSDGMTT